MAGRGCDRSRLRPASYRRVVTRGIIAAGSSTTRRRCFARNRPSRCRSAQTMRERSKGPQRLRGRAGVPRSDPKNVGTSTVGDRLHDHEPGSSTQSDGVRTSRPGSFRAWASRKARTYWVSGDPMPRSRRPRPPSAVAGNASCPSASCVVVRSNDSTDWFSASPRPPAPRSASPLATAAS